MTMKRIENKGRREGNGCELVHAVFHETRVRVQAQYEALDHCGKGMGHAQQGLGFQRLKARFKLTGGKALYRQRGFREGASMYGL